ncbi:dihydrodipicolinate synthase family protein [Paenibacillaceae bacterium]|nr:dihydrodipicolinate synthase family protein [Paenibacillaceae bacterium]
MTLRKEQAVGIVPPLMTPLLDNETLDEAGLVNLIHYNLDNGVHGIFTLGTSGEGVMVSRKIWKRVNEIVLKEVGDRVPVYCGAIDCGTSRVIENIKELEQLGAKTVYATPHFYMNNSCQQEIVRQYEIIARETNLEIMVYGHTTATGVDIGTDTIVEIAKLDKVVAFKDTRPEWGTHLLNLIALEKSGVSVFGGGEEVFVASLLLGSHGNISGLTNIFPKLFVDIYNATQQSDIPKAYELQKHLLEIKKQVGGPTWLTGMKYIAKKMKLFASEKTSSPIEPLSSEDRKRLDALVERVLTV